MNVPKILDPMLCWGFEPLGESGNELYGNCVFCGNRNHFYANTSTGQFQCKKCNASGNVVSFLTKYATQCSVKTRYRKLAASRSIPMAAFKPWKIGTDGVYWLLPCINPNNQVHDIRKWRSGKNILSTKGCKTQLFGLHLWKTDDHSDVWLCEGEWDAIALRYLLRSSGRTRDNVLSVPGAGIFKQGWTEYFNHRHVRIVYDNDKAGDDGSKRAGAMLQGVSNTVEYIHWPDARPDGFDIRDFCILAWSENVRPRSIVKQLLKLMYDKHRHADENIAKGKAAGKQTEMPPLPEIATIPRKQRPTFDGVVDVFGHYLEMDSEMVGCLRMILAVIVSNQMAGPPLWAYIVGPPSSGKTQLIQAAQSSDQVLYRSSVGPASLVSGWQGKDDPSLLAIVHGLCLMFKDGTEVFTLQRYKLDEVMGIFRGAYDGHVVRTYGNGVSREYRAHFSLIIGVTGIVDMYKGASLGERFLRFRLHRGSSGSETKRITAAIFATAHETEMERELRDVVQRFLAFKVSDVATPPMWYVNRIIPLCQLIALLRANVDRNEYTGDLPYRPEPEYGTRLAKQLTKLALSVAIVNGTVIDSYVYDFVKRIAVDTCNAFHLDIVIAMIHVRCPLTHSEISELTAIPSTTLSRRIDDLVDLHILFRRPMRPRDQDRVRKDAPAGRAGRKPKYGYVVANRVRLFVGQAGFDTGSKDEKNA